jgi:hypothetical protein
VAGPGFEVRQFERLRTRDEAADTDAPRRVVEAVRLAVVFYVEELISRCQKGVERLPLQQVAGDVRNRV